METSPIDSLLGQYSESHRNHINKVIHFFCVPAIVLSLLGMLWAWHPYAAAALMFGALAYYFWLSVKLMAGMIVTLAAMSAILYCIPPSLMLPFSASLFVIAWIGQFVGHKIEGKKPSFLDDVRFLLVGPLFFLDILYRRLGISR